MRLSQIIIFIMMHKILLTLNKSLTDTAISVCRMAHCSMGGQLNLCHWLTRWCPMLYRPGSRHTETNLPSSRLPQHLLQPALTCRVTPKMEKTPQTERRTVLTPYLVSHQMKLNHLTRFIIVHESFFFPENVAWLCECCFFQLCTVAVNQRAVIFSLGDWCHVTSSGCMLVLMALCLYR